jgi:ADP-heptose:LPS heptosyltransferase
VWLENYCGHRPYLDYALSSPDRQAFRPYRAVAGDLFFTADELAHADTVWRELRGRRRLVVSIEPHADFGPNKEWSFARWQQVVDALRPHVAFVQPSYGKPLLAGVRAAHGTFRGYAAVLAGCDLHLGPEGGLHHAAAALRRPAVVLFGGRTHPRVTGYAGHENVYRDVPGSPCGMIAPCAHCRRCMDSISVEEVVARACRLLGLRLPSPAESFMRNASRHWTARSVDRG